MHSWHTILSDENFTDFFTNTITVKQTATSTDSSGTNTFQFYANGTAIGNAISIKNGAKGDKGDTGEKGEKGETGSISFPES